MFTRKIRKSSKKEQRAFLLGKMAALQAQYKIIATQIQALVPEMRKAGIPVTVKNETKDNDVQST